MEWQSFAIVNIVQQCYVFFNLDPIGIFEREEEDLNFESILSAVMFYLNWEIYLVQICKQSMSSLGIGSTVSLLRMCPLSPAYFGTRMGHKVEGKASRQINDLCALHRLYCAIHKLVVCV